MDLCPFGGSYNSMSNPGICIFCPPLFKQLFQADGYGEGTWHAEDLLFPLMIAVALFLFKLCEPLRMGGGAGMCLFVRGPFIIDPYFKTKGNHQSVCPNRYSRHTALYELCYNEWNEFENKKPLKIRDTWYSGIWISIHLADRWFLKIILPGLSEPTHFVDI